MVSAIGPLLAQTTQERCCAELFGAILRVMDEVSERPTTVHPPPIGGERSEKQHACIGCRNGPSPRWDGACRSANASLPPAERPVGLAGFARSLAEGIHAPQQLTLLVVAQLCDDPAELAAALPGDGVHDREPVGRRLQ